MDYTIVNGLYHSYDEYLNNLCAVFSEMKDVGFRLNLNKYAFFKNEIDYLCLVISREGLKNLIKKNILEVRKPNSIRDVRSFIGITNYYSRFIC